MDEEMVLLSIANTYASSQMSQQERDLWKQLVKDSTDRRAYRIFNNGVQYDTRQEYFLNYQNKGELKMVTMYIGKTQIKVDLDNLLGMDVEVLQSIPYSVAVKYTDFIAAIEVCIEDCLGVDREIHDESSYKLALSELAYIIEGDDETAVAKTAIKENNKEEIIMANVNENLVGAVGEMLSKFEEAKETVKVNAGETAEEYIERVDDSLNVVKGAFGSLLDTIDTGLGLSAFKVSILKVIEAGKNGNSKHDLFAMAKECRKLTDAYITKVTRLNPDKAKKLKDLLTGLEGESIFTKLFSTLHWIALRVTRKLRKWFQVDEEKSVIGNICKSLSGFAGVLKAGVVLVWNTAKFAVSFIAAAGAAIADIIVSAIKGLVEKFKGWISKKDEVLEEDDDYEFDDDEFFSDEGEVSPV